MPRMVRNREIAGKRVKEITFETWPQGNSDGGTLHTDVRISFTDGSFIYFTTEESQDGGEYGTFVGYVPKQKRAG